MTKIRLLLATIAVLNYSAASLAREMPCVLTSADYEAIAHAINTPTANEKKQPGCEPGCVLTRDGIAKLPPNDRKNLCVSRRLINDLKIMNAKQFMRIHKPDETPDTVKRYITQSEFDQLTRIDITITPETLELLNSPAK